MNKFNSKQLLKWVLVLAFLLRVIALSNFPVGFTPDEASFAYDAYSILQTGKDQWGKSFPLVLESFGDYKSPLLSYLAIPFVWVLGLSKVAIRLPNALLGTAAVYVVYLLSKELFSRQKNIGLYSAVLLAISPWHIMMSRGAFEANLTTFLLPLGIYLFCKGMRNIKYLNWSAFVFGLNLFSYHSAKLVTPLVVAFLIIINWKRLKRLKKTWISVFIFSVFLLATAQTFMLGAGKRAQDVSVMGGALLDAAETRIELINQGMNPTLARLLHNKYQVASKRFIDNYVDYFSPRFLFIDGPAEATYGMLPGSGVLYWFEAPLLIGAILYLIKKGYRQKNVLLILFWVAVAPTPAALTMGRGFAGNRAVIMLPAFQILLAFGITYLLKTYNIHNKIKTTFSLVGVLLFVVFIRNYFFLSPEQSGEAMLVGRLEVAEWLSENLEDREIIVSRTLSEPQMYIAFANKWDPVDFQKNIDNWDYEKQGVNWVDQMPEYSLGKYTFKNIAVKDYNSGVVLVGKFEEFLPDAKTLNTFLYPSGKEAVLVVDALNEK